MDLQGAVADPYRLGYAWATPLGQRNARAKRERPFGCLIRDLSPQLLNERLSVTISDHHLAVNKGLYRLTYRVAVQVPRRHQYTRVAEPVP